MAEACFDGNCGNENVKCAGVPFVATTNFIYAYGLAAMPITVACPATGISAVVPTIVATGVAAQGFAAADTITMTRAAVGTWTCTGAGKFLGVC